MLADAGADPDRLLILERQEKADYIELGLPRQGIAKVLELQGVLRSEGKKKINYELEEPKHNNNTAQPKALPPKAYETHS